MGSNWDGQKKEQLTETAEADDKLMQIKSKTWLEINSGKPENDKLHGRLEVILEEFPSWLSSKEPD